MHPGASFLPPEIRQKNRCWFYGFMVLMVVWFYALFAVCWWFYGLWFYGFMVSWFYGFMVLWFYSLIFYCLIVLWFYGFLVFWFQAFYQVSISCFQVDIDPISKIFNICYADCRHCSVPVFSKSGSFFWNVGYPKFWDLQRYYFKTCFHIFLYCLKCFGILKPINNGSLGLENP